MSDFNMSEYQELAETSFNAAEPVPPEEEFFHSVYIAGKTRENHINIEEYAGKLQVRGVEYNQDKVCMLITNVKDVLIKNVLDQKTKKERMECFSYKQGQPPWTSSTNRQCGANSAERSSIEFCSTCKAQIIVSGIYCDEDGKPKVGQDGKPVFVFIRGKGMKYSNVSSYLGGMFKKEFPPLFNPPTAESKKFEKQVVNNKRCVTEISITKQSSNYGDKDVFLLEAGQQLSDKVVLEVLKMSKKTLDNFNEKFNWTANKMFSTSGYGDKPPEKGILTAGETKENIPVDNNPPPVTSAEDSFMSFEDVQF